MSTLGSSDNIAYIRAQIVDSDKELKCIIKDVENNSNNDEPDKSSSGTGPGSNEGQPKGTGAPRGRRPKPRVPIPPHAQPQRAMLMEVEDRWDLGYKRAFPNTNNQHKPWLTDRRSMLKNQWADDGWEV
jgi:hypothetical protein